MVLEITANRTIMNSLTFHTAQDWGQTLAAEGPVLTVSSGNAGAFTLVRMAPGSTLSFSIGAAVSLAYSFLEEAAGFLRTITVTAAWNGIKAAARKACSRFCIASRRKARILLQATRRLRL